MAYTAWSVVANEQPSTSKWNLLGSNDASFNNGSGIASLDLSVSALSNPYKFSAYKSSDQATVSSGDQITFTSEDYDTNSNFASSTYTAPVSGFYFINSVVYISSLNATARVQLYKNGSLLYSGAQCYGLSDASPSLTRQVSLTTSDALTIKLSFSGGGTRTVISEASVAGRPTIFEGHLISRT